MIWEELATLWKVRTVLFRRIHQIPFCITVLKCIKHSATE